MARRSVPEGIKITKVGLFFVLVCLLVGLTATNAGNNALYLVFALLLGILVVSGVASRLNVQRVEVALEFPHEVFAKQSIPVRYRIRNRSRWFPKWLLLMSLGRDAAAAELIPFLQPSRVIDGEIEQTLTRRGPLTFSWVHLASIFPLGLFRKGMRYRQGVELLVYPEIFSSASRTFEAAGKTGDRSVGRSGWGHELYALRDFRQGDNPRGIHWKRSARTGRLVFTERESEEGRRLSIELDNAVGELADSMAIQRFEKLVSEAATAAVDHLEQGFEVELITRDGRLPYRSGAVQRRLILSQLALLEPIAETDTPLVARDTSGAKLRLSMSSVSAGSAVA